MILVAFWVSVATVAWTYVGFPLVVVLRGAFRPRPFSAADIEPSVSVIIAARNEEASIGARLDNLAALDYPGDRLEVVVASDGSEDRTEAIVRAWVGVDDRGMTPDGPGGGTGDTDVVASAAGAAGLADALAGGADDLAGGAEAATGGPRRCIAVTLVPLPRVGKAAALNAAVAASRGEVLVFTDANSRFDPGAVRALVRPLADPDVGGVAGDQRYLPVGRDGPDAGGERSYWALDRLVKSAESRGGSVVSATGAIYAIRRSLFRTVPDGVTDDFAVSTAVVEAGFRLVFADDAVAWERLSGSDRQEFGRKVRIMTRGLRGVAVRRALLDPRRHGFYAVQLASHKLLRRLMAVPLAVIGLAAPLLWGSGILYRLAALAQAAFYALAVAGIAASGTRLGRSRVLALPAFLCLVNAASLRAAWNVASGRRIDRWEPTRSVAVGPPAGAGSPAGTRSPAEATVTLGPPAGAGSPSRS